ncbi:MAG: SHOCT domain-containing protein [Desulfosalsimonas sp.]|uniref:SHOCT domain-containing protein n=1 Tax=Desulfosalsimonas sp. TaxID=3073848 RepID=UPI003970F523
MLGRRPNSDQKFILSHLGVFYALVATIFVIPLFAAVVVVLIKGVFDLRHVILIGGAVLVLGFCIWMVIWGIRFFRKLRQSGDATARDFYEQKAAGEAVELSFFGGLFKVSYKGDPEQGPGDANLIAADHDNAAIPLLNSPEQPDLVSRLQALTELKDAGHIDEQEYRKIKQRLIDGTEN